MARIYDNIDLQFTTGLQDIITNTGVKRVDFCVGYFNLRGWDLIIDQIDRLEGDFVAEREYRRTGRRCRPLCAHLYRHGLQRQHQLDSRRASVWGPRKFINFWGEEKPRRL